MELLLLLLLFSSLLTPSVGISTSGDRIALLSFKSLLSDPTNSLSSWNATTPTCSFSGVTCDNNSTSGRVIGLYLSSSSLSGLISPSLSNLTSLSFLSLPYNSFTGPLPTWLGLIPTLRNICLANNYFTGQIPPSITNLRNLTSFDLSQNHLHGPIPPSIGNCTSLTSLFLAQNTFFGVIPNTLSSLTSLKTLDLSFNSLQRHVPSSIYNLSYLESLSLDNNLLTGTIPTTIGSTLPLLHVLKLEHNGFDGPIPISIVNLTALQKLDLYDNMFTGVIPSDFGRLQSLNSLNLGWNQLQAGDWSFLTSLTNCSNLRYLIMSRNRLSGEIPAIVGRLPSSINWVAFNENQITGPIPPEIGRLTNLTLLALNDNLIEGQIPTSLGKLHQLQTLNLSINALFGEIPASLGGLVQLSELYLGANELQGSIPASLGSYPNLVVLNISHNRLTGAIPKEVISLSSLTKILDLSHNSLDSSIPPEIQRLTNLGRLDISHNQLSGLIPNGIRDCLVLQYLYMGSNQLQGAIPSQLSNLRGIQELDLSHNNLTGKIPEFLGSLHYLNLSFNDLEGSVPIKGVFANITAISLQGNDRICGGDPKLRLRLCNTTDNTTSSGHGSGVLKLVIPISVAGLCLILLAFILYLRSTCRNDVVSSLIPLSEDRYKNVSYGGLHKATDGFSSENLVGVGSFGSVYRGRISGYNKEIAVKVLNLQHEGALKSFASECEALRNIRHRNIVKVVTSCATIDNRGNDFRALVFDYMPNGSLEDWLHPHGTPEKYTLSLPQRLKIAIDVASALEYLHDHGETPLVHCDLKPKYGMGEQPSIYGDTYSYGIMLLEMVTGLRPSDGLFKDGLVLHNYVEAAYPENVLDIVDRSMLSSKEECGVDSSENIRRWRIQECLISIFKIGLSCSQSAPEHRMEIRNVIVELLEARNAYLGMKASTS